MIKVGCSHTFCYNCLIAYVEDKLHASFSTFLGHAHPVSWTSTASSARNCHGDICTNCGVPWQIMMGYDEYQRLPLRCGHELCYSCGTEYNNRVQSCQCVFWSEDSTKPSATQSYQASEIWSSCHCDIPTATFEDLKQGAREADLEI